MNPVTRLIRCSDETYRILGVDSEANRISIETFLGFVHSDDREHVKKSIEDVLETKEPFDIEHKIVLPDGTEKFVHQHCELLVDDARKVTRVIGVIQDITDRQALSRMKSEFISTVSHELRTPLTSIKGALGLIVGGATGALPEKAEDMTRIAYNNANRLVNLVNDILDIEKFESGAMEFDFERLNLSDLITEAVEDNKGFADECGVTFLAHQLAPELTVRGDAGRLKQVMANLLSNAAKFSPAGGAVEVAVVRRDGMARVSIADHGPGIAEEFRDFIFGRFAQADSSDSRQKAGTGLGLNISRMFITKHGGSIDFETEPGVGTTFFFDIPIVD